MREVIYWKVICSETLIQCEGAPETQANVPIVDKGDSVIKRLSVDDSLTHCDIGVTGDTGYAFFFSQAEQTEWHF